MVDRRQIRSRNCSIDWERPLVVSKRYSRSKKNWFSLVILTSHFEATLGLFWDGPRNLNRGQMMRRIPELTQPSRNFCTPSAGGHFTQVRCNVRQAHKHDRSSVESGLEPGTLRLRSPNFTTWPPRLHGELDLWKVFQDEGVKKI
ncbi:hypothetical protein AVEN_235381-1 [Araneus ventricosus]|uniref:Uncharacterized protein n=1 Tax=Araneus ventricosus TaxID=182803 RepID=A0A4Y2A5A6_ARAVE|nr:hypothetical protein AVEN_235381-1 [Araneus ventricosus]